jgi:UDP-3-O-[3-hydroxymyristoyl] glucosamine N-acyltransferase
MGDGSMGGACTAIAEDVDAKAVVVGAPALPHRQWLREQGAMRHLPELRNQVKKLQDEVERLKAQLEAGG